MQRALKDQIGKASDQLTDRIATVVITARVDNHEAGYAAHNFDVIKAAPPNVKCGRVVFNSSVRDSGPVAEKSKSHQQLIGHHGVDIHLCGLASAGPPPEQACPLHL